MARYIDIKRSFTPLPVTYHETDAFGVALRRYFSGQADRIQPLQVTYFPV